MKTTRTAIFCFRRDLRVGDNIGLHRALEDNTRVIPVFIFDPRQLKPHEYRSERALHFLLQAVEHLDLELRDQGSQLLYRSGTPHEVLPALANEYSANTVYLNRDYTLFSIKRDQRIIEGCSEIDVEVKQFNDAILQPPEACLKADNTPYTVFTPFYNRVKNFPISAPEKKSFFQHLISSTDIGPQIDILSKIGRQFDQPVLNLSPADLIDVMSGLSEQTDYGVHRNELAADATTHLSVFLKFGVISVREVYQRLLELYDPEHPLIRQLYWRDFYSHIAYHFPHVFGSSFKEKYAGIPWRDDSALFDVWCTGTTGFPIVDAGMRELNATGFMHNRARMITASFLVKDLHIDWRWGEKYFATKLTDYDPALNNGNWQWAASTGCDAQPYFRIFNPWLQQKRFDPQCEYIKRWIPELSSLAPQEIHGLVKHPTPGYPEPMVNHGQQAELAKQMYREAGSDPISET